MRDAEKTLNTTFSKHIYLMLTDHLLFAMERQKQGVVITNRVFWEIKNFYRREFDVGLRARALVRERLGASCQRKRRPT